MIISPHNIGAARTCAAAVIGVEGHLTQVQAIAGDHAQGLQITGLPDAAVRETGDRVYAAVCNSGQTWPARAATVDLLPAGLPRPGTGFDLAIAVAVLAAAEAVPTGVADGCVFTAELALDGRLRPVRGVAPALRGAAKAGCTRAVVAVENAAEAVMVAGLTVTPCRSLREVLAWLRGEPFAALEPDVAEAESRAVAQAVPPAITLAGLGVPAHMRLALEACAAGGHHLCLTGPHGAPIPALAVGLAGLLPALGADEVTEVTDIYSVAGLLGPGRALIIRPPFRAPHHTASPAAILGGGCGIVRPGEAALAHRGVLFLGDAPEFDRSILASLRQPLETGEVAVARAGSIARFPARFILVAGVRPCPCGGRPGCECGVLQARRYRARLASELGSWISLWLHASGPGNPDPCGREPDVGTVSATRVAAARHRARRRLRGTPWRLNEDIPAAELRRSYQPTAETLAPISRAVDLGEISARTAHQVVRVAWTLADLQGEERPGPHETGQALAFQLGVAR